MVLAAVVVPVAGGTTGLTARLVDMMVTLVVVVVMVRSITAAILVVNAVRRSGDRPWNVVISAVSYFVILVTIASPTYFAIASMIKSIISVSAVMVPLFVALVWRLSTMVHSKVKPEIYRHQL